MSEAKLADPLWQDKPEFLPGGKIMAVMDIAAMMNGESFRVADGFGVVLVRHSPLNKAEAIRHIDFYTTSKRWGLPSGRGWANETQFCMKMLMHLDELTDEIDAWRIEQARK